MKIDEPIDHRPLRKKQYPDLADQIDTILKAFLELHQNGIDVGEDMQKLLANVQQIKTTYPKR